MNGPQIGTHREIPGAMVSLTVWLTQMGIAPCTAWRWRKRGWLRTVNIAGRVYLTTEAIHEFTERAKRGDFAQRHTTPTRPEGGQ